MIYAKEIYEWLKTTYKDSSAVEELGVKEVGVGPSSIIPGPTADKGGVAKLFPIVHIAESPSGNAWDTGEQTIHQSYGVRIKYYRILESRDEILEVMSTELAKLARVLETATDLDYLNVAEASPERIQFNGGFQIFDEAEAAIYTEAFGLFVGVGWFDINININHII